MQTNNKLYKSQDDKALFGVCGGIAEYFNIDSLIVRLLFVLFTLMYGVGILFYIIATLVIPYPPSVPTNSISSQYVGADGTIYKNSAAEIPNQPEKAIESQEDTPKKNVPNSTRTIGLALIAIGALILIQVFLPWIDKRLIVAICLIFAGFIFLSKKPK